MLNIKRLIMQTQSSAHNGHNNSIGGQVIPYIVTPRLSRPKKLQVPGSYALKVLMTLLRYTKLLHILICMAFSGLLANSCSAASTKEYIASSDKFIAHAIVTIDRSHSTVHMTGEIQLVLPKAIPNSPETIYVYIYRIQGTKHYDSNTFDIWIDDLIHGDITDKRFPPNANIKLRTNDLDFIPSHSNGKTYHFVRYIPGSSTKPWLSQLQLKVTQWQREQQKQRKATPKPKPTDKPATEQ